MDTASLCVNFTTYIALFWHQLKQQHAPSVVSKLWSMLAHQLGSHAAKQQLTRTPKASFNGTYERRVLYDRLTRSQLSWRASRLIVIQAGNGGNGLDGDGSPAGDDSIPSTFLNSGDTWSGKTPQQQPSSARPADNWNVEQQDTSQESTRSSELCSSSSSAACSSGWGGSSGHSSSNSGSSGSSGVGASTDDITPRSLQQLPEQHAVQQQQHQQDWDQQQSVADHQQQQQQKPNSGQPPWQQDQLQEQNRPSLSPEQLQLQHLRYQALKLQALEQYQELMQRHPSSSSGSSRKRPAPADEPADCIPVLEAATLIAKHAHPELSADKVREQLDNLAAEVQQRLPNGVRYPLRVIKEINRVLYDVHGFQGNHEDYYHPDNSCVNRVLETKKGIPISLSIVYMEVAKRLGLPMAGVNLPAHFMVRPQVEGMELLVDPFNGGQLTALQDAEEVLGKLMGYQVKLDPRFVTGDTPYFTGRQLLLRLLNNLRQVYITLNMAEEALAVVRYMQATVPEGFLPELKRDEGLCLYGLGRLTEAGHVLSEYLAHAPDTRDAAVVTAILYKIKERAAAAAQVAAATAAGIGSSNDDDEGEHSAIGSTE